MRHYRQRLAKVREERSLELKRHQSNISSLELMRPKKEAAECATLMKWAAYRSVIVKGEQRKIKKFLFHIPNGGSRNIKEAMSLKRQGVTKGVSDYFLAIPVGEFAGFWLEMKRDTASACMTESQEEFQDLMGSVGYKVGYAKGWRSGAQQLCEYLEIEFKE